MTPQDADEDHPAKRLGRKLREARIAAGYRSQQAFGEAMPLHRTTVAKIESGQRHINTDALRRWCELCHVDYELYEASARLAWVAEASPVPVWFEDFRKAQMLAHTIRTWHPIIIPGPLQTAEYLRALHLGAGTPDDLIDERVAARIDLQQQTIERRPPVELLAVMDEVVLHRQVGSEETRYRQLVHLAEQAQRTHIGIQVVPAARGANAGNVGAFMIASLDDSDVILQEGAYEDTTTDKRSAIRAGMAIFDKVRLVALSGPESLELIMKVAESCKP